jgi:Arc/MetJ-type ribon-helix-helix transcriptional regulator
MPTQRSRTCPREVGILDRRSMVTGMATRKVTVTLDEAQVDKIRKLVDAGAAASVSGFVHHAVSVALDDVAGWGALLAEALSDTGGPLTDDERAWADQLLGTRRRRGSAA